MAEQVTLPSDAVHIISPSLSLTNLPSIACRPSASVSALSASLFFLAAAIAVVSCHLEPRHINCWLFIVRARRRTRAGRQQPKVVVVAESSHVAQWF